MALNWIKRIVVRRDDRNIYKNNRMNYLNRFLILIFFSFYFSVNSHAQHNGGTAFPNDTTQMHTMAAGGQFKASGWKEFWWGKHWRPEWIKPVSFPVFDINTTAGGFKPTKMGGGHQTKSLRMLDKDGREWVLRTIDKDLELLMPEEFKGSIVHDIINDQISTAHPYGPLAIASLTESIGSMHTNPTIVFVPDDPAFGEYQKTFANKLCLFEERPSGDGWEKTPLTKNADDVVNTEKLYSKLQKDNDRSVDQHEFLKIRLLDMLVNDWDRHPDQWVWAGYKMKDDKMVYHPFARDRDQAFSKTDGVNIFLVSMPWILRSVRNFKAYPHDIAGVNLAAVSLDQQYTNELTKEEWLDEIKKVQAALPDEAIHKAVMTMPKEITDISGASTEKRLKQRRDNMMGYGMKYYKIINKKITILGSDKHELFLVNKIDHNKTEITIRKISKENELKDTLFHRIFTHDLTKEINLYGYGDEDRFVFTGDKKNSIYLRCFGGDGNDSFIDSTSAKGSGKRTRIYETKDNNIGLKNDFKTKNTNDTSYLNFVRRAFKYNWWKPVILPGFSPDDGVLINLGIVYRKKEWHKTPYSWEQSIVATMATETGSVGVKYDAIFKQAIRKWDIELAADYKAPKYVLNFYGFGNETKLNGHKIEYFRVRSSGFSFSPAVSRRKNNNYFRAGLIFQSVKIQRNENKFVSQPGLVDSSVFDNKYFGGATVSYDYLSTAKKITRSGYFGFGLGAKYITNLEETDRNFFNFNGYVKFNLPIIQKRLSLAHRTGAATNTGNKYEFYQANAIGGHDYLRGYWRTRFTGKSSLYQNTELRVMVANLNGYVLRGSLAVYGFFDDGRVWIDHEDSNKFHTGYGGGIVFIPYNTIAFNLSYGVSEEANVFMIKAGLFF